MNRSDLRNKMFAAGRPVCETVPVPGENGETLLVDVHGLSAAARGRLLNTCMITDSDGDDDDEEGGGQVVDLEKITPRLVIETCFMHGTDERVFDEGDEDMVGRLNATFLDPLFKAAARLSGLEKSALKAAEGNSAATTG